MCDDLSWDNNSSSAGQSHTDYLYDANGNVLRESYRFVDSAGRQQVNQQSVMAYDALNRLVSIDDSDYHLSYRYDELGNRRAVQGAFNARTGVPVALSEDDWYTYDTMNRLRITQGSLVTVNGASEIQIGTHGTALSYNGLDARTHAETSTSLEVYSYNEQGQLTDVRSYKSRLEGSTSNGDFWVPCPRPEASNPSGWEPVFLKNMAQETGIEGDAQRQSHAVTQCHVTVLVIFRAKWLPQTNATLERSCSWLQ